MKASIYRQPYRKHASRLKIRNIIYIVSFISISLLSACANGLEKKSPIVETIAVKKTCIPSPFGKRELFLRGSFNTWNAKDAQRFSYVCNRYELITDIKGDHKFKIGDENWSADADFGTSEPLIRKSVKLEPVGKELSYSFTGRQRITLDMSNSVTHPILEVSDCANAPLGDETIYLRGGMNTWNANEDYAFQFRCDAYYLNVNTTGKHEFRIGDVSWSDQHTFAAPAASKSIEAEKLFRVARIADATNLINLQFDFKGEHTLRLAFDGGNAGSPSLTIGPKQFENASENPITDLTALSVQYDSRSLNNKSPFGAVITSTPLNFSLSALPGIDAITLVFEKRRLEGNQEVLEYNDAQRVSMIGHDLDSERQYWTASKIFENIGVYGYYFEIRIGEKLFIYQNNRDEIPWTRERGTNGVGVITEMPESTKSVRRFRQTVYRSDYQIPEWSKDAVYYYIFPERFRNGDKANDPKPGVTRFHDHSIELHPQWMGIPYRPNTGDGSDAHYNNDFFGGDLIGVIEKLDYIAALGANTIYMTPVFHAASNHKYDTADYSNIDPHFGNNEDFKRLCKEAQKRGIRIVLDASLNHTGSDSIYFDRFKNFNSNGAFAGAQINSESPYSDWYSFDASKSEPDAQYKGWVGVRDLPELNKSSKSFRDYAYGSKNSIMKQWLDRGASGWRMDVAPWVPDDFWREWRTAVKGHNPNALTVAESYFDSSKFFLGDTFDSTMNYIFRNAVIEYANGKSAVDSYRYIEFMREAYPQQSFYALMNLLSSHDQPRSLHVFAYVDEKTDATTIATAKQKLKLAVFFQMIFPGSPAIYYGDEVGVIGGEDPYNRAPYPWADQGGMPDNDLLNEYKKLIQLRKDHDVLRHGSIDAPLLLDKNVIVLLRKHHNTFAITAMNNAETAKTVSIKLPTGLKALSLTDALSKEKVMIQDGKITFTIPAQYGLVLVRNF
jgi:cyclomaltodextrinase / maltogenic alpha-amylase / neopullulanase